MDVNAVLNWLRALAVAIWAFSGVQFITYGVLLNFALAVAVSLRTQTFTFRALADFLGTQLLPNVVVYAAFAFFSQGTGLEWVGMAVLGLITTQILSSIVEKLALLGVPVPSRILYLVRRPSDNEITLTVEGQPDRVED